jgi:hypothetical protein
MTEAISLDLDALFPKEAFHDGAEAVKAHAGGSWAARMAPTDFLAGSLRDGLKEKLAAFDILGALAEGWAKAAEVREMVRSGEGVLVLGEFSQDLSFAPVLHVSFGGDLRAPAVWRAQGLGVQDHDPGARPARPL